MRSAQSLRLSDRDHQSESGPPSLDDAADTSANERVEIAAERSQSDARGRWPKSNASRRSSRFESDRLVSKSPSIGKRLLRAILRFSIAILIGVVGTLSWQSYGDEVQDAVRTWAPSLGWLIPPATTKSATANASAELAEQLKPIALDLAVVRKAVEQLAVNQEQLAAKDGEMAQGIAALQTVEQELGDKISSQPAAPKTAHTTPRRAPQHPPQPLNVQ